MEEYNELNNQSENNGEETVEEVTETVIEPTEAPETVEETVETATEETAEEVTAETTEEKIFDYSEFEVQNNASQYVPPYNPVNYSRVTPEKDKKPASRGFKLFILLLVAVMALTAATAGGYYLGKSAGPRGFLSGNVAVGLKAKPKNTDEMTAAEVYQKLNDSVVGICIYNQSGAASSASGVIYSENGYVITNDHIYAEVAAAKFKIYTADNKEYDAEYVAGDKVSDIAVLKIKNGKFKKATFGNSDQIVFGENVVAIGRQSGASNASSITKGVISATSRRVQTTSSYSARLIETDCPINPGNSGGALVNMYGQIVGITSSKLVSSDIDAVGYAIPTVTVKKIAEELIKNGKVVSRAKLGITYMAVDSVTAATSKYAYEGLYVDSVSKDSDLYNQVVKGDTITHINGIKVTRDEIVLDIIEKSKAGDKIKVTFVNKNGKSKTVSAVLKANVGESSYHLKDNSDQTQKEELPQLPEQGEQDDGNVFNFPFGE